MSASGRRAAARSRAPPPPPKRALPRSESMAHRDGAVPARGEAREGDARQPREPQPPQPHPRGRSTANKRAVGPTTAPIPSAQGPRRSALALSLGARRRTTNLVLRRKARKRAPPRRPCPCPPPRPRARRRARRTATGSGGAAARATRAARTGGGAAAACQSASQAWSGTSRRVRQVIERQPGRPASDAPFDLLPPLFIPACHTHAAARAVALQHTQQRAKDRRCDVRPTKSESRAVRIARSRARRAACARARALLGLRTCRSLVPGWLFRPRVAGVHSPRGAPAWPAPGAPPSPRGRRCAAGRGPQCPASRAPRGERATG